MNRLESMFHALPNALVLVLVLLLPSSAVAAEDPPQELSPEAKLLLRGHQDPAQTDEPSGGSSGLLVLEMKPTIARILTLQARRQQDQDLSSAEAGALDLELQELLAKFAEEERDKQFRAWQHGDTAYLDSLSEADRALLRLMALQGKVREGESLTDEERAEVSRLLQDQATQAQWRDWRQLLTGSKDELANKVIATRQFVALFEVFAGMNRRRHEGTDHPTAEQWEQMAQRCRAFCQRTGPKAVLPFLMHVRLLEGESELFASLRYYKRKEVEKQVACYQRGIGVLDLLLQVEPGELPPTVLAAQHDPQELFKAGRHHAPTSAEEMRGRVPDASVLGCHKQARHFLDDYCPWGAQLFFLLRDAGLTAGMDWRILPVYGESDVVEIGPAVLLPTERVPVNVRAETDEIAALTSPFVAKPLEKMKWDGTPAKTYMLCYLSPQAYDIKKSDVARLAWKAWVLYAAGPAALVEDALQDYAVAGLEDLAGKNNELYATVNMVHTADNYGFDKSWLLKGKPEFKKGKFGVNLLTGLLQMYEGRFLERLFSGLVPELKTLKGNVQDPRTYAGHPMPPVIIRSDVHGLEKVKDDEYPRAWDIASYYQLNPTFAAGQGRQYDLARVAVPSIPIRDAYLRGEKDVHLLTWIRLPTKPKPYGLRFHVTDFAPMAQELQIDVLDDPMDKWKESLKSDEELVALLRYTGSREVVPGSVLSVHDWRLRWRIQDERRRKIIEGQGGPQILSGPSASKITQLLTDPKWTVDRELWIPVPKIRYLVEFLVCKKSAFDFPDWKNPVAKKAEFPVRFRAKGQVPSGKQRTFAPGCVELLQDYGEGPFSPKKIVAKPITLPPKLLVKWIPEEDRVCKFEADTKTASFEACLTPVRKGWHVLRVKVGDKQYTLRAHVPVAGLGANFHASEIPVPIGEVPVVVTAEGTDPVRYKWKRPKPEFREQDFEKYRERAAEYERKLMPPIDEEYVDDYWWMQSYRKDVAECHMKLEQYDEAEKILAQILSKPASPSWYALAAEPKNVRDSFADLYAAANRMRADAAFHRCDAEKLDAAEKAWIKHWKKNQWGMVNGKTSRGKRLEHDDYVDLEGYYRRYLSRYLLLGGSSGRSREIHGKYIECCRQTGMYDAQYDPFKYQIQ